VPAFSAPLHPELDPEAAAARAERIASEARCTCGSYPCGGPTGESFWDCDLRCRACRLPPWTAPTRTPAFARDGTPEGANDG